MFPGQGEVSRLSKRPSKYAVVKEGKTYREIADIMTKDGHKMNKATARETFLRGLIKIAKGVAKEMGEDLTDKQAKERVSNPMFQEAMAEIIRNLT